jgi:hypothetical protein
MEINKAQQLWCLLNRFDRDESEATKNLLFDQTNYPFFYLLNWNFNQGNLLSRKTALNSPLRTQYQKTHHDAPEILNFLESNNNQNDIIDDFLKNLPSLTKPKKGITTDDLVSTEDLTESNWSPPISETFAIILVKQQKYQQAINIYEQLILAKPEKRLYFATRISELKQIINE